MPHYYYYGIDIYYFILILPAFIISLFAQIKVSSTFSKYSKSINMSGLTGAKAAEKVLHTHGVYDVRIERIRGNLTDHFDPRGNVIRLSDSVYDSTSVAAIGVAAHEAGHAVQHAVGYGPIKLRTAIIPMCQIGSNLAWPLILLGIVLSMESLATIGVIFFSTATLFQLVTLPCEFNASSRALAALRESGRMGKDDLSAAKKTLTAAALTYLAALAVSILNLLRIIAMLNRNNRD
jgi:Zn-dependent membrane protease YugP